MGAALSRGGAEAAPLLPVSSSPPPFFAARSTVSMLTWFSIIFGFLRLLSAPPLLPLMHIAISGAGAYAVWEHPHEHPRLLKAYTLYAVTLFLGHTALFGLLLLSHFPATASAAVAAVVPPLYASLVAPLDALVAALGGGAAGSWWAAFGVATSVLFDGLLAWSAWSLSAQVTLYCSLVAVGDGGAAWRRRHGKARAAQRGEDGTARQGRYGMVSGDGGVARRRERDLNTAAARVWSRGGSAW